jgi:leucyl-tRNA synthetase
LPAEQHGFTPRQRISINTAINTESFRTQIHSLGFTGDWNREDNATSPPSYHWLSGFFYSYLNMDWLTSTISRYGGAGN